MAIAPVANDDRLTFQESTGALQVQVADLIANDVENDTSNAEGLTVSRVIGDTPPGVVASIQDTYIEVQLPADYYGTFRLLYTLNDGGLKDEGIVEITVENVNDVPNTTENGQAFTVQAGTTLTVENDRGVLAAVPGANENAFGEPIDGDTYTAVLDSGPSNGTLQLSPEGGFTYTPNQGFTGEDTFTYYVSDGQAQSAQPRTATITVPAATGNQKPTAVDDSFTTPEDQTLFIKTADVLANDSDPEGSLAPEPDRVYGAVGGTVNLEDANIIFNPDPDFNGTASFIYVTTDGTLEDIGKVEIEVTPVNDAPVPNREPEPFIDRYAAYDDETLNVVQTEGVLFNDVDVDGDKLTAQLDQQASNGTVNLDPDGSFTYTPNAGFTGEDSFFYTVTDGQETSVATRVEIEVLAGEDGGNGTSLSNRSQGTAGADTIEGTSAADEISAGAGDDYIAGKRGNDTLQGQADNDRILGGDGADLLIGALGNDTIYGGGDGSADRLLGGAGRDLLFGQLGDDELEGGDGDDVLNGGGGADRIAGGSGLDRLLGAGGNDNLSGGDGADSLYGSTGADTLTGDGGDDLIFGEAGDDALYGALGADTLRGGGGNDGLYGGAGSDSAEGGDGADQLYGGSSGADSLDGGRGSDFVYGESGNDRLLGGDGFDLMNGGEGNDLMLGGNGNDRLLGNLGADRLGGGTGDDTIYGGGGNFDDTLLGGGGNDDLYGQGGLDTFVFVDNFGQDRIQGFSLAAGEKIDLSGVTEITDFDDLTTNHLSQSGSDAVISDGTDTITLFGIDQNDLEATDFIF